MIEDRLMPGGATIVDAETAAPWQKATPSGCQENCNQEGGR